MHNSPVSGWRRFLPGPSLISMRERIYAVMGALLGLLCCEWISQQMLIGLNPWFIGPMGASAVLLFAAPTTPMAQPRPMLGGNLVSGVIGVLCAKTLGINGVTAATHTNRSFEATSTEPVTYCPANVWVSANPTWMPYWPHVAKCWISAKATLKPSDRRRASRLSTPLR